MERSNDDNRLATALAELRPAPRDAFAKELDERVAAGFPRHSRLRATPLSGLADWIRGLSPQRLLLASGSAALATIALATVIVAGTGSRSERLSFAPETPPTKPSHHFEFSELAPRATGHASDASNASGGASAMSYQASPLKGESEIQRSAATPAEIPDTNASANLIPFDRTIRHREIERSAEIGLLADPADVADDSAAVFAAVHDAHGVVLHSTTTAGKRAGARFDLLIPSAKLGDALAAFSAIDEVGTRHEATDDITAPTVAAGEQLRDSRARIDALLAQLSNAETESEMEAVEAQLARERRHAARLQAYLDELERRTDYSHVSLRIETRSSSADSGGTWGIDDAFGDAGHILGIAAGVTLVGLAVIAPLALFCLLSLLTHRAWVRAQRKRALGGA